MKWVKIMIRRTFKMRILAKAYVNGTIGTILDEFNYFNKFDMFKFNYLLRHDNKFKQLIKIVRSNRKSLETLKDIDCSKSTFDERRNHYKIIQNAELIFINSYDDLLDYMSSNRI